MKTTFKDWPGVFRKLKKLRGVTPPRKSCSRKGWLPATPEERMRMHDDHLRSLGLYSHWDRKKYGFKS